MRVRGTGAEEQARLARKSDGLDHAAHLTPRRANATVAGVGRLLWIALALALAVAAGYALLRQPPQVAAPPASRNASQAAPGAEEPDAAPNPAPHADIDDASRAALERILREADERDEAAKRR